jgi:hypothetical protein
MFNPLVWFPFTCGPRPSQRFDVPRFRPMVLEALPQIGLDRLAPADGAFYVYADVSRWTDDAL